MDKNTQLTVGMMVKTLDGRIGTVKRIGVGMTYTVEMRGEWDNGRNRPMVLPFRRDQLIGSRPGTITSGISLDNIPGFVRR